MVSPLTSLLRGNAVKIFKNCLASFCKGKCYQNFKNYLAFKGKCCQINSNCLDNFFQKMKVSSLDFCCTAIFQTFLFYLMCVFKTSNPHLNICILFWCTLYIAFVVNIVGHSICYPFRYILTGS